MLNLIKCPAAAGGTPRQTSRRGFDGVLNNLILEVDSHGAPVSVPAAEWFVCFVPGLKKQWWHRFASAKHQHVFAIRMLDDGRWILIESWWTRMLISVLSLDEALKFLRWGAAGDILQVQEAVPGCGNQVRGWSNCAILIAFLLGRSYWTWTPHGLYRRLVAEPGTRHVDLPKWLANHVRVSATHTVDQALGAIQPGEAKSLETVLLQLGKSVMTAWMSRSALGLHKVAVSEPIGFVAAANAYWEYAPQRLVETVRKALQQANSRNEARIDDPEFTARQFVAMLRGDIHQEILFGLRSGPDATEIHVRVESVVDLLLNGALAAGISARKSPSQPRRSLAA